MSKIVALKLFLVALLLSGILLMGTNLPSLYEQSHKISLRDGEYQSIQQSLYNAKQSVDATIFYDSLGELLTKLDEYGADETHPVSFQNLTSLREQAKMIENEGITSQSLQTLKNELDRFRGWEIAEDEMNSQAVDIIFSWILMLVSASCVYFVLASLYRGIKNARYDKIKVKRSEIQTTEHGTLIVVDEEPSQLQDQELLQEIQSS